jgi:hypothetical protein
VKWKEKPTITTILKITNLNEECEEKERGLVFQKTICIAYDLTSRLKYCLTFKKKNNGIYEQKTRGSKNW